MTELIFFGILAAFVLFQLFNVLGRKVGFQSEEKPVVVRSDQAEVPARLERMTESPKIVNLDILKTKDIQFNETIFLEKIRETYEQIAKAYHTGDLSGVKDRLTQSVYESFEGAIANRAKPNDTLLSFIDNPKADIESIVLTEEKALIKVRFLAELLFEIPQSALAEASETRRATSKKESGSEIASESSKSYRRTAEYWTFEKSFKLNNALWLLNSVKAAKA